jgi:hypothetical protein
MKILLKMPRRALLIYFLCKDQPRCLKEISRLCGYKSQSALSHHYEGKTYIEWMLDKKILLYYTKRGRETFFIGNKNLKHKLLAISSELPYESEKILFDGLLRHNQEAVNMKNEGIRTMEEKQCQ